MCIRDRIYVGQRIDDRYGCRCGDFFQSGHIPVADDKQIDPVVEVVDCLLYTSGSQLMRLGEYYARAIHETYGDDFDVLFGPAYKGIPISVVTAVAFHNLYGKEVRYCSDRKEEKDHGADKGSFLGSKLKDGDRVVMIEDVTTSGKSMEETVPKVRGAADVTIVGLMVSLNRMEKGLGGEKSALEEIREKYGFETNAIVTMEEVVEHLYNLSLIHI